MIRNDGTKVIDQRIKDDYYLNRWDDLRRDGLKALGIDQHPKADTLFEVACDLGSSQRITWGIMKKLAVLLTE
jgi:hypothetical protein